MNTLKHIILCIILAIFACTSIHQIHAQDELSAMDALLLERLKENLQEELEDHGEVAAENLLNFYIDIKNYSDVVDAHLMVFWEKLLNGETEDITAPVVIINTPSENVTTTDSTYTIAGTLYEADQSDVTINIYWDEDNDTVPDAHELLQGSTTILAGETSWSVDTRLVLGHNRFVMIVSDTANNVTVKSVHTTITQIDRTGPVVELAYPRSDIIIEDSSVTLSGTIVPEATDITASVWHDADGDGDLTSQELNTRMNFTIPAGESHWEFPIMIPADTETHLYIKFWDYTGNISTLHTGNLSQKDLTSPHPTLTNPVDSVETEDTYYQLQGTLIPDPDPLQIEVYRDTNNNGTLDFAEIGSLIIQTVITPQQSSWTVTVDNLQNDGNYFVIKFKDASNNVAILDVPTIRKISPDTTPPTGSVALPSAAVVVDTLTYTIGGVVNSDTDQVDIKIIEDTDNSGDLTPGESILATLSLNPGQTRWTKDMTLLADTTNNFAVLLSDQSNNKTMLNVPTITHQSEQDDPGDGGSDGASGGDETDETPGRSGDPEASVPTPDSVGAAAGSIGNLFFETGSDDIRFHGYYFKDASITDAKLSFDWDNSDTNSSLWTQNGSNIYYNTGSVGIGVEPPFSDSRIELDIRGTVHATSLLYDSDERLKRDILPIPYALEKLTSLRGVHFVWKDTNKPDIGVIAQDVEAVLPEAVITLPTGTKSVDYARLVPLVVQALKEQQQQIDTLYETLDTQ